MTHNHRRTTPPALGTDIRPPGPTPVSYLHEGDVIDLVTDGLKAVRGWFTSLKQIHRMLQPASARRAYVIALLATGLVTGIAMTVFYFVALAS